MNNAIQPIIVLLILSLITEKISNFIKLQFNSIANKRGTIEAEKIRGRNIQYLTLAIGIAVAIASKANLFLLFKNNFNLFWTSKVIEGENLLSNIIGSIVSGIVLSSGSKFFHDLQDILLLAKNLKRKLNDKVDLDFNNIEPVDHYIKKDESNRIENSLITYKYKIMQIENVVSVSSIFENGNLIMQVHVNRKFNLENLIPKKIFYTGVNNSQKEVLVNIIHDYEPISHGSIFPSNNICNLTPYLGNTGSVGGKVFDETTNEEYFVSCYHVVKSPNHDWDSFQPIGNETILNISDGNSNCGLIIKAIRDDEVDIAVMRPINGYEIKGAISGIGTPYFSRALNNNDKIYKTQVKMNGTISGFNVGFIIDINLPVKITYFDGSINQLNKMIFIQALSNGTFSQPGDSGSFVVDEYNYLIGVLVGGFQNTSYIIPIDAVFTKTKTKITKS